jgi:hypothetical protein
MKIDTRDDVKESAEHMSDKLLKRSLRPIGSNFSQCFHGRIGCGVHLYIYANRLSLDVVSAEFGPKHLEDDYKDKCKRLKELDNTAEMLTMDTEFGGIQLY